MPVRKIPIGTRAVTGQHARSGQRYESSLERDFFKLMTYDPLHLAVEGQPVTVHYLSENGEPLHYTPDGLATFKPDPITGQIRRPLLVEVKYRDEYRKIFLEIKPKLRAARRYAKERGWQFRVFTEREIRTTWFANMNFLDGFRDREPNLKHVESILDRIGEVDGATPAKILSSITSDLWQQAEIVPTMWWMVAHSQLHIDLSAPLNMHSTISTP